MPNNDKENQRNENMEALRTGNFMPKRPTRGRPLSEVEEKPIEYIMNPYIPRKEITVLNSDSGMGKNRGLGGITAALADGEIPLTGITDAEKIRTVFISGEDKGEEDFAPRLRACKNKDNIWIIDKEASVGLSLDDDEHTEEIRQIVRDFKADLLIIDPLQNFIGESVDMNKQNQVRVRMQRLSVMASQENCAIIIIAHRNKRSQEKNVNNGVMGSQDIVAAARSVLTLIYDDRDPHVTNRRLLVHTKSNGAPCGQTILFGIREDGIDFIGYEPGITKQTLEGSDRHHQSLSEYLEGQQSRNVRVNTEADHRNRVFETVLKIAHAQKEPVRRYTLEYIEAANMFEGKLFETGRSKNIIETLFPRFKENGYLITPDRVANGKGNNRSAGIKIERLNRETDIPLI